MCIHSNNDSNSTFLQFDYRLHIKLVRIAQNVINNKLIFSIMVVVMKFDFTHSNMHAVVHMFFFQLIWNKLFSFCWCQSILKACIPRIFIVIYPKYHVLIFCFQLWSGTSKKPQQMVNVWNMLWCDYRTLHKYLIQLNNSSYNINASRSCEANMLKYTEYKPGAPGSLLSQNFKQLCIFLYPKEIPNVRVVFPSAIHGITQISYYKGRPFQAKDRSDGRYWYVKSKVSFEIKDGHYLLPLFSKQKSDIDNKIIIKRHTQEFSIE